MLQNARFAGRTVVVTGAAGGIGQALAERFHAEGANLVLVDVDAAALHAHARTFGERALACPGDVSVEADTVAAFDTALRHFGRIDAAALNAGIEGRVADLEDQPVADFDRVIGVNLRGVFLWMSCLMRVMKEQNGGAITVTSSTGGLRGSLGLGPYVASKHAVIGLVKCAALEGARDNVRVNAVVPGAIDTRMLNALGDRSTSADEVHTRRKAGIPLKRYGRADEVAALVAFLSSDEAAYCTGATYQVDGGVLAGRSR